MVLYIILLYHSKPDAIQQLRICNIKYQVVVVIYSGMRLLFWHRTVGMTTIKHNRVVVATKARAHVFINVFSTQSDFDKQLKSNCPFRSFAL